jgi:Fe-S-cluster-containing hydrogenase component 2
MISKGVNNVFSNLAWHGVATIESAKCIHCYHCSVACKLGAVAVPAEKYTEAGNFSGDI